MTATEFWQACPLLAKIALNWHQHRLLMSRSDGGKAKQTYRKPGTSCISKSKSQHEIRQRV